MTIEKLIEVVREASTRMLGGSFNVSQKDGYANIVTTSDVAVQDFLCQRLGELLPGSGFLCEEEDMYDLSHEYTWIIDPIDGTANYARGIDQCAICVGLKHLEEMEMAVVYLPRTDELFWAVRGEGAFRNGERIHVSDRPYANAVMCTALPVYYKAYAPVCSKIITEVFGEINDIRRFGAAAPELCYLAMGRIELYFEYLLSPWDYAAASLILTEAGGLVTNLEGAAVSLTKPSGVLAANNAESLRRVTEVVMRARGGILGNPRES